MTTSAPSQRGVEVDADLAAGAGHDDPSCLGLGRFGFLTPHVELMLAPLSSYSTVSW